AMDRVDAGHAREAESHPRLHARLAAARAAAVGAGVAVDAAAHAPDVFAAGLDAQIAGEVGARHRGVGAGDLARIRHHRVGGEAAVAAGEDDPVLRQIRELAGADPEVALVEGHGLRLDPTRRDG